MQAPPRLDPYALLCLPAQDEDLALDPKPLLEPPQSSSSAFPSPPPPPCLALPAFSPASPVQKLSGAHSAFLQG